MEGNSSRMLKPAGRHKSRKVQSAMEYLATYGWAILIAAAAAVILYFFASSSTTLAPASCSFAFGAYCQDLAIGSNVIGSAPASSGAWLFLTNSQQYLLVNPQVWMNASGIPSHPVNCIPANVLPGGAILCTVTLAQTVTSGALVSGKLHFSAIPCPSGNALACASGQRQNYLGNFNAQAAPSISANIVPQITLAVGSASQTANGGGDQLTATVSLPPSNAPIPGATVNFVCSFPANCASYVTINPANATTDSSGHAASQISSRTVVTVTVNAIFAGYGATNTVAFTSQLSTLSTSTTSTTSTTTSTSTTSTTSTTTSTSTTTIHYVQVTLTNSQKIGRASCRE